MSALNCFVTSDAIHLFTDGAMYELESGKLLALGSKIISYPHLNCVLGYAGTFWGGELARLAMMEAKYATFDALVADFPNLMRVAAAKTTSLPGWPRSFHTTQICLAGWSERSGQPEAWLLRADGHEGKPPWNIQQITRHQMPLVEMLFKLDPAEPEASGVRLLDAQRKMKCFPTHRAAGHLHIYGVGGFAQHTTIRRDEITTKVVRRWVDPIGEKIDPFSVANGYERLEGVS